MGGAPDLQPPPPPPPPPGVRFQPVVNFGKDGPLRIPSLSLQWFQSGNASGVVAAWRQLLAAADADPTLAAVASFRYDLVDVGRQALMDLWPRTYSRCPARQSGAVDAVGAASARRHRKHRKHRKHRGVANTTP